MESKPDESVTDRMLDPFLKKSFYKNLAGRKQKFPNGNATILNIDKFIIFMTTLHLMASG